MRTVASCRLLRFVTLVTIGIEVGCESGPRGSVAPDAELARDAAPRHDADGAARGADASLDGRVGRRDAPEEGAPTAVVGAVYTSSNQTSGNAIVVFPRAADGSLRRPTSYPTGGTGTGYVFDDSQGALAFDPVRHIFVTVNRVESTLSVLALDEGGALRHVGDVPSGGSSPISVTMHGDLLYALNEGASFLGGVGPGGIAGFRFGGASLLPVAISGSVQPLSTSHMTGAAQIAFTPDGGLLVVTERFTGMIDTYRVGPSGAAGAPLSQPSSGETPYGFSFSASGHLIVSEAHTGTLGLSTMSSYAVARDGTLTPISKAVPTEQTDDCWIVVVGGVAYGTNTKPGGSITGMRVSPGGALSLLDDGGVTGVPGKGCEDEAVTSDGEFLYTLNALDVSVSAFRVMEGGALLKLADYAGVPRGSAGLIAR